MPRKFELGMDNDNQRAVSPPNLTVVDVYELASCIGKEFERAIDAHGPDSVSGLMPRVICVLEYLESFAANGERENGDLAELRNTIAQLETEKVEKAEYRQRFESELEQIEEGWRTEKRDLLNLVSRLQEENDRIRNLLTEAKSENPGDNSSLACVCDHHDGDLQVIQRLRSVAERNQELARNRDRELREKSIELEQLQSKVENLSTVNRDLLRKNRTGQSQLRALSEERAELQVEVQTQQRVVEQLKQRLGVARKENEDLNRAMPAEVPDLRNKIVFDLDDPDRPRFTLQELKNILFERNDLKARCSEMEDELAGYRPRPQPQAANSKMQDANGGSGDDDEEPDDLPVQGPINKEPDDAPWRKKQESGIRKLFRRLFGETGEGGRQWPAASAFGGVRTNTMTAARFSASTSPTASTSSEPTATLEFQ